MGTSVTSTDLPKWVQDAGKENYDLAKGLTERPYQAYGGPRTAGFNTDQVQSFDVTRSTAGSHAPGLRSATGALDRSLAPVGAGDIDQYMNPFNSRVIDTVEDELARRTAIENKGVRAAATKRGQYALPTAKAGGSRLGVYESRNVEANKRILADVISNLYAGGYDKAVAQANVQKGREAAAAPVYSDIADRTSKYSYRDAAALSATGAQQQQEDQRNLDLGYADFLRQQGYPLEMLNVRMGALSGSPYESKQTTAADVEKPSSLAQAIGAGAALWGLGAFA